MVPRFVCAAVLGLASFGCSNPTLKMEPGTPIEMKRGYCFVAPEYIQARRARDRGDTLEQLSRYKETAPHVSRGDWLRVGGFASSVVGISAGTAGVLGRTKDIDMDENTATILLASGIALQVVGIGLCIAAEGQFASAVEVYNEKIVPTGGARDTDDSDPSAEGSADGGESPSRTEHPGAAPWP